ncbi:MAG: serpin family protein [Deltaproteobacteria bacterium]|nr:serpin family protein [Deltaproteobacteria bacterium]
MSKMYITDEPPGNPRKVVDWRKEMKKLLVLLSMILFGAVLTVPISPVVYSGSGVAWASGLSSQETLVQGNTAYAVQLYRELGAKEGNLFFSPYSVSSALGMTYAGARGNTEKEMKDVLHFSLDQADLPSAFKKLNRKLSVAAQKSGQKLNIANALVLTGGDVDRAFKNILKDKYDAEIFSGGLGAINGWVKKKTEGKIEKILEELDANSVCVLLNAIYFKGTWASPFEKRRTVDAPFKVSNSQRVTVPLMYQKDKFKMLTEPDFQMVDVPYRGQNLSMVILLPQAVEGLAGLEKQLSIENLQGWLSKLDASDAEEIKLYLPKFKLETGYDLVSPSQRMGMKDAFDLAKADFSGMGWRKGSLYISQIKHKAVVEVNEEGTEAAAATAVEMATKSMPFHPVFRADHPFFFMIRDKTSGTVLFMGRMVDPGNK